MMVDMFDINMFFYFQGFDVNMCLVFGFSGRWLGLYFWYELCIGFGVQIIDMWSVICVFMLLFGRQMCG